MDSYEEKKVNELGTAVSQAVQEVLDNIEVGESKIVIVEHLHVTVRYASGGGAVSCEIFNESAQDDTRPRKAVAPHSGGKRKQYDRGRSGEANP